MQNNKYIYIETYGCSANKNNSEIIAGLLVQAGYDITNNEKIADIIIINSCVVKSKTESKIKRRIKDLSQIYPDKLTIITGCMPETDKKQIQKLNPKALLLGTHHFKSIINLIKDYSENKLTDKKQEDYLNYRDEEKILLPKISFNKLISIIQISEGCLGNCSYCKTRMAKGKLFSYPEDKIIKSIENDLKSGAKEVWITSQDCAAYGLDKNKQSQLPELLSKILSLKHNFKLRLGMSNPNHIYPILDELIKVYKNKKIYKFIHIPIQSADNQVLKHMNRKYNINQAIQIINKFRQEFPDITMATDIIAGYPAETQQAHENNLNFIKSYKSDVFNLSKFSSHKNTGIYKQLESDKQQQEIGGKSSADNNIRELPISVINKRTAELMKAHQETALQNKKKFLNKTIQVFVNSKKPGFYEARDDNYNIILINSKENLLGKNIKVKINQIGVHHMIGEIR